MTTASPWAGLAKCGLKPQLVGSEPTKPKAQRNQRTAFDGPGTTSAVTLAVKPRQTYKRGPGIVVLGSDASRRDADKRFGMRWSRI